MPAEPQPPDPYTVAAKLKAQAELHDAAAHGQNLGGQAPPPGAAQASLAGASVWSFLKQLPVDQIAVIVKEVISLLPHA